MIGLSSDVKKILLYRCPKLSDGARLTLLTWFYCLDVCGSLPSLQETANLRGCGRSTIQMHLKEALDFGALTKKNFGVVSAYHFQWRVLMREMGFNSAKDIDIKVLVGTPAPKHTDADEMAVRVLSKGDVKSANDLLMYFKAVYREKLGKAYVGTKVDRSRMRLMINTYGATSTVNMVMFFLTHRGRLCLGDTDVETLFKHRESIYAKTKNTRV